MSFCSFGSHPFSSEILCLTAEICILGQQARDVAGL